MQRARECWAVCWPVLRHEPPRLVADPTCVAQSLQAHWSFPPQGGLVHLTVRALPSNHCHIRFVLFMSLLLLLMFMAPEQKVLGGGLREVRNPPPLAAGASRLHGVPDRDGGAGPNVAEVDVAKD